LKLLECTTGVTRRRKKIARSRCGATVPGVKTKQATTRENRPKRIGCAQVYRVLHRHGWRKVMPRSKYPKKASEEVIETSKKINIEVQQIKFSTGKNVRLMFQDEAGFGRINKPKYCWCRKGIRGTVENFV